MVVKGVEIRVEVHHRHLAVWVAAVFGSWFSTK
jgi:hypothetical protein